LDKNNAMPAPIRVDILDFAMRNFCQRRVLFGFLLCVLLAASMDAQQASPSIAGDYAGVLGNLHVVLHLQQDAAGTLTGTLDSVDQKAYGLTCGHVTLSGRQFSFEVPVVHGSYKGQVSADAKTITGTWNQGSPQPLKFKRHATTSSSSHPKATRNTFEFAGHTRTFYAFVPNDEGPLPLMLLLHGSGRNGQIMVDAWKDLAAREHFILAAPDAYDPAFWQPNMDTLEFLHAVVDQVEAKHAVDRNRIYLFGHSAGAVYSLLLAIFDSHYFAAIALHAGALQPDQFKFFANADRRMPIAILVGDRDPFFPLDRVNASVKEFKENGFSVELTIIPHHDHNYYVISDEVNGKAWEFLKKARLRQPEVVEQH
jgi:predicted esterase